MFSRSVVAALVAAPFLATAFAASCTRTYTVKEGDWCDTISAANNVSTYQLAAVNPSVDDLCDNLEVGQNLCLGTEDEDCTNTHVVEANDTCDDLYNTYGLNATILYNNNPQLNSACDNMYIGEVICVANSALAPVPPSGLSIPTASSQAPATTETELPWCDEL
uniref:LysM domain-containing protein n=1 Tax=Ganoderma boninense TaxID=34458 RepID=A0A5K1JWE6_9APHY|nr:LysM domain-containing protein [Ganoderma boninense]